MFIRIPLCEARLTSTTLIPSLRYRPWLPDRFDAKRKLKKRFPVAVYPNHFDRRIAAQRSGFTIHGLQREGIEQLFRNSKYDRLAKIIVPSYAAAGILDELDDYGIDEVTIYPDLQGLGTAVTKSFLEQTRAKPRKGLYTRLGCSPIHGVGVFAIKKIPKGTLLFSGDTDEMLWVKLENLPKQTALRKFYEDFGVWKNGRCGCPEHFHRLTMSWYINDPKKGQRPNVECDDGYEFLALRNINEGEELTVDSTSYSDHKNSGTLVAKNGRKKS
jgi:hypothetical protein